MQGQSLVGKRLRFRWSPVLVWKIGIDEATIAWCYGWTKTIYITRNKEGTEANGIVIFEEIIEEKVFDYYYYTPQVQPDDQTFDQWIETIYQEDLLYLDQAVWTWIEETFSGKIKGVFDAPA